MWVGLYARLFSRADCDLPFPAPELIANMTEYAIGPQRTSAPRIPRRGSANRVRSRPSGTAPNFMEVGIPRQIAAILSILSTGLTMTAAASAQLARRRPIDR